MESHSGQVGWTGGSKEMAINSTGDGEHGEPNEQKDQAHGDVGVPHVVVSRLDVGQIQTVENSTK